MKHVLMMAAVIFAVAASERHLQLDCPEFAEAAQACNRYGIDCALRDALLNECRQRLREPFKKRP
jgi:hypothetical protein